MARKQKQDNEMPKTITSLSYNDDFAIDEELIAKANTFCNFEENKDYPPTTVIRKFLTRKLQEEINRKMKAS